MTIKGKRCNKTESGFTDQVLAVAVSPDDRYVASGGRDKLLRIWDLRTNKIVASLRGHRDVIFLLCFVNQRTQHRGQRIIRSYHQTLERGFRVHMETLFGHQSELVGLDA